MIKNQYGGENPQHTKGRDSKQSNAPPSGTPGSWRVKKLVVFALIAEHRIFSQEVSFD